MTKIWVELGFGIAWILAQVAVMYPAGGISNGFDIVISNAVWYIIFRVSLGAVFWIIASIWRKMTEHVWLRNLYIFMVLGSCVAIYVYGIRMCSSSSLACPAACQPQAAPARLLADTICLMCCLHAPQDLHHSSL